MELHLFDFDGTLFKSPHRPDWWSDAENGNWFVHHDSLARPCVPDHPDDSWWSGNIVGIAKRSISDPNVVAILCTGRPDKGSYKWRIPELLHQQGLRFEGVYLSRNTSVRAHKAYITKRYLESYPAITTVQMWDDTQGNLLAVKEVTEQAGLDFIGHLVKEQAKEPICTRETYDADDPYQDDPATKLAKRWLSRFD